MTDRDCNETLRELELFLDGEMTSEELTVIRAHLEGCFQADLDDDGRIG